MRATVTVPTAALLLLAACGGGVPVAPDCTDPATVERALANVFVAVNQRGASTLGGQAQANLQEGFVTTGADTMRFHAAGDTLMVRSAADSVARPGLILRDIRTTATEEAAGAFRCAATLEAPLWGGDARPIEYLSIISPDDEHVVTGQVLGDTEPIPF
ncbi:MAG: hypothetical protein WEA24_11840 [Gemmatimonadota bacterium]